MFQNQRNSSSLRELLKLSLVPIPLQECQLSSKALTCSESIEWLLDLKERKPVWSRLNDINTSGYKRKLPMSMAKNYDIEVKGRLWSLWGSKRKHKGKHSNTLQTSKSYMAITVMALCAARAIRLNIWTSKIMDTILENGKLYYKQSLKNSKCSKKDFQLENLYTKCMLEGISFKICLRTCHKGLLYCTPLKCQPNLAFALVEFFSSHQFGILECNRRLLGIGFINGPIGNYFMFDAQCQNYPLFSNNISAPYVLRTNHLQVLLYCLIISINAPFKNTPFSLHELQIEIVKPQIPQCKNMPCQHPIENFERILPEKYWKVPCSISPKSSKSSLFDRLEKCLVYVNKSQIQKNTIRKYRRKIHNIKKEEVKSNLIKPLVDADRESDEDLKINKDFVRMICSDTTVPLLPEDKVSCSDNDFVQYLVDALIMGPKSSLQVNIIKHT